MSENEPQDLGAVEISIEQCQTSIMRKGCLDRLQKNKDFQSLIMEGFLEKHAVRQVQLKAHPGLQDEKQQNMMNMQITAIGGFKQYLVNVYTEGMNAEVTLVNDEKTREEILAEDLQE